LDHLKLPEGSEAIKVDSTETDDEEKERQKELSD